MSWLVALFARVALLVVTISKPCISRGLDSATAGDPLLADYHPDLRPGLLHRRKCDRLGLALGRPGSAARPGSE